LSEINASTFATGPTNLPPAIAIVFPPDSVWITTGVRSEIRAVASDPDGQVTLVQFFVDGNLIATNSSSPYTNLWRPTIGQEGSHILTAIATDNLGASTISAPVNVLRTQYPGQNDYLILTPTNGSVFVEPAVVEINARLTASDGRYRPTDFFLGTSLIGTVSDPPYRLTVSNLTAGNYALTVVANTNTVGQQPGNPVPANIRVVKVALTNAALATNREFQFDVQSSLVGQPTTIQGSADLIDWLSISTNVPTTNVFHFIDTQTANYSRRFYRVVVPPCPHCQSPHTELLEIASSKTFTVYRCFKCSLIWRVPNEDFTA
jgi:hypothetical protein